jgi:hypothetical protein
MILRATYNLLCTATICLGLVLVMGCDSGVMPAGSWEYQEIGRFKSPDSLVDAVLIEGGGGATTSTIQYVCLLPAGGRAETADREAAVFAADHVKNLGIDWRRPDLLEIGYDEARIASFRNIWYRPEVEGGRHIVEIRLAPTSSGHSLPLKDRIRDWQ